jgi:hypothetical protein
MQGARAAPSRGTPLRIRADLSLPQRVEPRIGGKRHIYIKGGCTRALRVERRGVPQGAAMCRDVPRGGARRRNARATLTLDWGGAAGLEGRAGVSLAPAGALTRPRLGSSTLSRKRERG